MQGAYLTDQRRLWSGEKPWDGPLCVIDLDRTDEAAGAISLPPCPVIGIGDPAHPLAPMLDAVAETEAQAGAIERQVGANPHAAAVIVQLLRILPGLTAEQGLTAESFAYGLLQGSSEHAAWLARREPAGLALAEGKVRIRRDGDCLDIILDRPEAGNAIDRAMRDRLRETFELATLDEEIRVIRLGAVGRTFCLGADLDEFGTTTDPATAHQIRSLTLPAHAILRCAGRLEVHIQGGCVGSGLEMAAFARRITASPDAWFQLPELGMGILPGAGGCISLSRRIGRQRTGLMILSGRRISARQALAWGLIDAVTSDEAGADHAGVKA